MEFLGEEVDGALTAQKLRGETRDLPNDITSAAALHVNPELSKPGRKDKYAEDPLFVFFESKGH